MKSEFSAENQIVVKEGTVQTNKTCDNEELIEEVGTDLLDPSLNLLDLEEGPHQPTERVEDILIEEVGKDDIKTKIETLTYLMKNGSECCSTDENKDSEDEKAGKDSVVLIAESPLTARTDALLQTKSFNLVKPKTNL